MLDATGELALPGSIKYNCLFAERTHEQFDESHFGKLRMACLNCKPDRPMLTIRPESLLSREVSSITAYLRNMLIILLQRIISGLPELLL